MNADPGKAQDSLHVGKQERLVRSIPRLPGVSVRTSENGYKYHQVPAFHGFFNRVMSHVPRYLGVVQVDHIYIYIYDSDDSDDRLTPFRGGRKLF